MINEYIKNISKNIKTKIICNVEDETRKYLAFDNKSGGKGVDVYPLTQDEVWALTPHRIETSNPNGIMEKLILAVGKFGDSGCTSEEANREAFPEVKYNSDGNPFACLSKFLESVDEENKLEFALFDKSVLIDKNYYKSPILNKLETTSYIGLSRVSRSSKKKYRLSNVGKHVAKCLEENIPYFEAMSLVKDMLDDKTGIAHYLVMNDIRDGGEIDVHGILDKFILLESNKPLMERFSRSIVPIRKKLQKIVV